MPSLAAYPKMMRRSRQRLGLRECRAARLLGLTVRQYRALEAGDGEQLITSQVWERMVDVFGWPGNQRRAPRPSLSSPASTLHPEISGTRHPGYPRLKLRVHSVDRPRGAGTLSIPSAEGIEMHKRTGWGARAGIMRRLGVVILLTSHAALLMMPAQANARLVSQEHQLHFIETEDHTICENIQVHTVYEYWALVSSTHMSTSGFPLNTMSGRYMETIYDLHSRVEILKFTQTGNLFRDVKATDNRDGTFTRVGFASGTEQMIYKGKAIDRWTGTIRYRETIDYNGTPMNEDDDTWLDFQIVSMSGGPHDELNGCAFLAG